MVGTLNVIGGCMFSGKTGKLIDRIAEHRRNHRRVLVLSFMLDNRYTSNGFGTHNGKTLLARKVMNLTHVKPINCEVIAIDEFHLFHDYNHITNWLERGYDIEVALINSDMKKSEVPAFSFAVSIADSVTILRAKCADCFEPAIFSQRTAPMNNNIIGGSDLYAAKCRQCFVSI